MSLTSCFSCPLQGVRAGVGTGGGGGGGGGGGWSKGARDPPKILIYQDQDTLLQQCVASNLCKDFYVLYQL